MEKVAKQSFIFLVMISGILSGCGAGKQAANYGFSTDASINAQRELTTTERNIATRICYAYQSKSQVFRTGVYYGSKFNFSLNEINCKNTNTKNFVATTLKYDDALNLLYTPQGTPNSNFMGKVQTDTSGYLANLCFKIKNNQPINNTSDMGNFRIQINFFHETTDGFNLRYFINTAGTEYKLQSDETFRVRTQSDMSTGKILGMDEYYRTRKICTTPGDTIPYSTFEQSFSSRSSI